MADETFKGFHAGFHGDRRARLHPRRRFPDQPDVPAGGGPRRGQDDPGPPVPARRGAQRRARRLRHPLGDRGGAARRRRLARLVARRHHHLRAADRRGEPEGGLAVHPVPPLRGRALGDHPGGARHRRAGEADAGGLRLALRDAAAGPRLAALPAADPGAQALLHRPELHGAAARLHRLHHRRLPAPEPHPRRGLPRAARARLRRPAAAAAGAEGARRPLPRRLPRLPDRDRRPRGLPAAGGGRPREPSGGRLAQRSRAACRSWTPCWAAASSRGPA